MRLDTDQLRQRVLANTSTKDGRLENAMYELDARTMAILSKRRQISVR